MTPEEERAREYFRTFYPQKKEEFRWRFSIAIVTAFLGVISVACAFSEPHFWLLDVIPETWPKGIGPWCDWLGETFARCFVLLLCYGIAQVLIDTEKHRK